MRAIGEIRGVVDSIAASVAGLERDVAALFRAQEEARTSRSAPLDYHQRRADIVELLRDRDYGRAEAALRPLLDEQWKVPENVYLCGVLQLLLGRVPQARAAIDHALSIKPWIREVPLDLTDLASGLRRAQAAEPDWTWPRYRFELDEYLTYGMTLTSVLSTLFEHENVFAVQVGAFDGIHDDPLHGWIVKFGWRGILLEPLPGPYAALVETYKEHPQIVLENCAISDEVGTRVMYTDPGGRYAISSFVPERNLLRRNSVREEAVVRTTTFDALLDKHDVERIDILQIDAEGYDFEVLRQFDLERYRPAVVNLEFYSLPFDDRLRLFELLRSAGYAWRYREPDLLCVDRERVADHFGLIRF